jgi:hypothetical protein
MPFGQQPGQPGEPPQLDKDGNPIKTSDGQPGKVELPPTKKPNPFKKKKGL